MKKKYWKPSTAQLRDWSRKSMNFLLHQRTQERKQFLALQVLTQANLKKPSFLCCTKIPWKRNSFHGIFLKLFYRISIISFLFFL